MTGFSGGRVRRWVAVLGTAALVGAAGPALVGVGSAGAATCTPSTTADDGSAGSLRGLLENLTTNGCAPNPVIQLAAGATYNLTDGGAGDIFIDGPVIIEGNGATIRQTISNERVLDTDSDLTLRFVTITGGRLNGGGGGGINSNDDGILPTLRIENSTITDNTATGDGGGIEADGPLIVINSTISNNSGDDGGGIRASDTTSVTASTISGNCSNDDGGAIQADGDLRFVNSTVTNNISDDDGAIDMNGDDDLTLVYSDVVANTLDDNPGCPNIVSTDGFEAGEVEPFDTNEPSNINIGDELFSFGSVVARPLVGPGQSSPFNCDGGPTQSSGYNFSDDLTCGFGNSPAGDRQGAGDPLLGALASNGGSTKTLLPQAGSPLLNFIPLHRCVGGDTLAGSVVSHDQRGIVRPQATGCEIGSVEVVAEVAPAAAVPQAVLILPRFTG